MLFSVSAQLAPGKNAEDFFNVEGSSSRQPIYNSLEHWETFVKKKLHGILYHISSVNNSTVHINVLARDEDALREYLLSLGKCSQTNP